MENTHVNAYILAKYGPEILPTLTPNTIKLALEPYFGFVPDDRDLSLFLTNFKGTHVKYAVTQGLRDIGLSQYRIAELTGLSQPSISRYLKKPIQKEFKPTYYTSWVSYEYSKHRNEKYSLYYSLYCKQDNYPVSIL